MQTALSNAVDRLEAVLVLENETLRSGDRLDLVETTGRKNQSLLELSRLARGLTADGLDEAERTRLEEIRRLLGENRIILERHVKASHEIAGVMTRAIEEAESDGTYTSRPEFAGRIR